MKNITVIIHTYNEEKNIQECILSTKLLTENIIVIDMKSIDKTLDIVEKHKVQVFTFPFSHYVEPAREFGINKTNTDWVFILDSDERITKELALEIKNTINNNSHSYYKISRKNIFGNKWLKHGGWSPDYQIRLINKKYFVKWPKEIHSTPVIKGNMGFFKNHLIHLFHGNFKQMVNKTIIFEDIESDLLYKANKNASTLIFIRKFIGELTRRLLKHVGFLDGTVGIMESVYQAFSKTITYIYLYEKKKSSSL